MNNNNNIEIRIFSNDRFGKSTGIAELFYFGGGDNEYIDLYQPGVHPRDSVPFQILSPTTFSLGDKNYCCVRHFPALFNCMWEILIVAPNVALEIIQYLIALRESLLSNLETKAYSYNLSSSQEWKSLIEEAKKGIGKRNVSYVVRSTR